MFDGGFAVKKWIGEGKRGEDGEREKNKTPMILPPRLSVVPSE